MKRVSRLTIHGNENVVEDRDATGAKLLQVSDFGAVGDGIHDDGPAIHAAIRQAIQSDGKTVVKLQPKTYFIGEKEDTWPYFGKISANHFTIEGSGATLLFSRTNVPFYFENCTHTTIRNLNIDYREPTYTQGRIVAVDRAAASFDLQVDPGFPDPPTSDFIISNHGAVWGGGGRHGLIFEPDVYERNRRMTMDHVYYSAIQQRSEHVYRFTLAHAYANQIPFIQPGDRATYGISSGFMTKSRISQKEGFSSAAVAITRSSDFLVQNVNLFGTLAMGYRVYDNYGKITFDRANIVRKPGTDRLLSSTSDGFHTKNNRIGITFRNCLIESSGDDLINISTMVELVVGRSAPNILQLRSTDNIYYYYTIQPHDQLLFYDRKSGQILGTAMVTSVQQNPSQRLTTVVLDHAIEGVEVGSTMDTATQVMNMNQVAAGTLIENNVFRPVLRNAMLVRMVGGTINNNVIEGFGGMVGIQAIDSGDIERPFVNNLQIENNKISNVKLWGIKVGTGFPREAAGEWAGNVRIRNNEIVMCGGFGIQMDNANQIQVENNRIQVTESTSIGNSAVNIRHSANISIDRLSIQDPSRPTLAGILLEHSDTSTIEIENVTAQLAENVPSILSK